MGLGPPQQVGPAPSTAPPPCSSDRAGQRARARCHPTTSPATPGRGDKAPRLHSPPLPGVLIHFFPSPSPAFFLLHGHPSSPPPWSCLSAATEPRVPLRQARPLHLLHLLPLRPRDRARRHHSLGIELLPNPGRRRSPPPYASDKPPRARCHFPTAPGEPPLLSPRSPARIHHRSLCAIFFCPNGAPPPWLLLSPQALSSSAELAVVPAVAVGFECATRFPPCAP